MSILLTFDPGESSLTVAPSEIANDGESEAIITQVCKTAAGVPMNGIPASLLTPSVTGSGNTVTPLATHTDENGTIEFSLVSTGAATKTISGAFRSVAFAESPTVVVSGSGPVIPDISEFWNSSEVAMSGGLPVDSNIILADDGCHGFWYKGDGEGKAGAGRSITVFTGAPDASGNLQYTKGWWASIYNVTPIPYPAGVGGVDISSLDLGAQYANSQGTQPTAPTAGADFMAAHDSSEGSAHVFFRYYYIPGVGFLFGAMKMMTINPPNWGSGAGATWAIQAVNIGGSSDDEGLVGITLTDADILLRAETSPGSGTWYRVNNAQVFYVEVELDRSGAPGTHVCRGWVDMGGALGDSFPGSPTLRWERTNLTIDPISGAHTQFGSFWKESWANPQGAGPSSFTNLIVTKNVGPIGFRSV